MSRVLLQYLLPLLLPTIIWLVWYFAVGYRQSAGGRDLRLAHGPWFWLFLGGVGLLSLSLIYTALTRGYDPSGTYEAPHLEDGRVVPGRVRQP